MTYFLKSVNEEKNEIYFSFLLVGPGKNIVEEGRMTKLSSEQKNYENYSN